MIQFRKLSLARGVRVLVEDASFQIHPGWRVGLVGANGTGKSSLFALLRGELHPETGDLEIPAAWRIASVSQETPALAASALDYVLDGDTELRGVEGELEAAEGRHDGDRIGELHVRLQEIDGYSARSRAASLLAGLGFSEADTARPVAEFSGGWRMRLNLAQALIARADLLLLDEPTNHLDLDAIVWLEKWLSAYRGTIVVVSHDRDFLDGCVSHVAAIESQQIKLYTGNYSAYEDARAAQLAVQQAMYARQQREIEHMESFIARFRAQATKARQAQSRLKALARMERISAAHVDMPFDFVFPEPARAPDVLMSLDGVSAGYGGATILRGLDMMLRPGTRLGLLGPNGAGKSTLMKILAGELAPAAGRRIEGKGLAIGYFAQHQLEQLRPSESPLQHFVRLEPATREQELRDYLGGFDFRGDMAAAPVERFSGGEKSRLALALIVRQRPNLLLLDEPTNHLDLEMRTALTRALSDYDGSLVLVSHDRALLRTVCDELLLVHGGAAQPFDGDLDDYLKWLAVRREEQTAQNADVTRVADRQARKDAREQAGADRQAKLARRRPLVKEGEKLERQLATWHEEKHEVERQLADPSFYENPDADQMKALGLRQQELTRLVDEAEMRWLEVHSELEEIGEL
jgi:ATP-binding cassette subfamily F protein 3